MGIMIAIVAILCTQTGSANPISVDHGNEMTPMPYEETSVYMSRELIVVTFGDMAKVNATYTFTNDAENATNVSILLPFYSEPGEISILAIGTHIAFDIIPLPEYYWENWTERNVARWNRSWYHVVLFSIDIPGNDSVPVNVRYQREYESYSSNNPPSTRYTVYHSFKYITWTASHWNHTIESAIFEFHIPKESADEIHLLWAYEISERDGHVVAIQRYEGDTANGFGAYVEIMWEEERYDRSEIVKLMIKVSFIVVPIVVYIFRKRIWKNRKPFLEQPVPWSQKLKKEQLERNDGDRRKKDENSKGFVGETKKERICDKSKERISDKRKEKSDAQHIDI